MSTDPAFRAHDHARCARSALSRAEDAAQAAGLRLTPVRRRTLEILLEDHRAMGAYQVLDRLAADGFGTQPPVVYRALQFLVEHGFAHRVRRLNAFAACLRPGAPHVPAFFICETCESVAETAAPDLGAAIAAAAPDGFAVGRTGDASVEAVGLCPACRDAA